MQLLVIDPQNDFVLRSGSLSVPGAEADLQRLVGWVDRNAARLDAITVTLDQHHLLDISHPGWWRDAEGQPPAPFTAVTAAEVEAGRWRTADPAAEARTLGYLRALEASGRYPHVVWPEHCLIGDPGANVYGPLSAAIHRWERARQRGATWVLKGTNPWTEHFSAIRAEVPDPDDRSTQVSPALVQALAAGDELVVAGEARSHCVANTVRDLVAAAPGVAGRLVLLADATSDVPGFERFGEAFVRDLSGQGMRLAATGS